MNTELLIKRVDGLRHQVIQSEIGRVDLLRLALQYSLDWGVDSDKEFTNEYTGGATMQLIIKGISSEKHPVNLQTGLLSDSQSIDLLLTGFLGDAPLTIDRLREAHRLIIKEGGDFRTGDVTTLSNEENNVFCPSTKILKELGDLVCWYNENLNKLHPLIFSALFHYTLVKIHPFKDGNGRIARIISSLILLKFHIPPPVIRGSEKGKYIHCLRLADRGHIDTWVEFVALKVFESLENIISMQAKK